MEKIKRIVFFSCLPTILYAQEYEILMHDKPILIQELKLLNSRSRECNLSILPNSKSIYFMSDREMKNGNLGGNGDIYRSDFRNGEWGDPIELGTSINTFSGEDEPTFSSNGTVMYYQSWAGSWKSTGGPYYMAKLVNGVWEKQGSIGKNISQFFADQSNINFGYATDGMAVSPDGNLFIVACGADYNGAMDLYYSVKKNNVWSYPELMGISTDGDERSVFIAGDSKTIYYSSDGMGGFGGLDIFKVKIQDNGKLGTPVNIGEPFNTAKDDMGFVASADGKSAFFIRNLDIYYADISQLTEAIKPMIQPVIEDIPKPEKKEIISNQPTVYGKKDLIIYFDFDKSLITQESLFIMNQVKSENITSIELNGYCDSDGSKNYNFDLASRRCEAVIDELVKKGIPLSKIKKHVFGESKPAANNASENGKALNRRVVIKLN
jgi:outer membrane protein OmpA-like peptidoglycan-associated protein